MQPYVDIFVMSLAFSKYTQRLLSVSSGGMRGVLSSYNFTSVCMSVFLCLYVQVMCMYLCS